MPEAAVFAKQYVEDMLTFFGLNTEVAASLNEDGIVEVQIPSTHMNGFLIGQHGDVLRSIQYLVTSAMQAKKFDTFRVNVDVAEYKKQRNERLEAQAAEWIQEVKNSGVERALRPMNAADRRIVHHVAAAAGIESASAGEGRERHIILKPNA